MRQDLSRRGFIKQSAGLGAGACLGASFLACRECGPSAELASGHPRIHTCFGENGSLRSVEHLRRSLKDGHSRILWQNILQKAEHERELPPYVPESIFPGRVESQARHGNVDYSICHAAGQRLLRAALIDLIDDKPDYRTAALAQMDALFDRRRWPEWIDRSHKRFGYPADLRTGMLSHDVALAYDWLYPRLSPEQRQWIVDGLDRCGIQPYLQSLEMDPWWTHELNNWLTVIVGGLGIAGMALDGDHPDARRLIDYALPQMQRYLSIYGPEGEFNESPAYGGASEQPTAFFNAYRYYKLDRINMLAEHPFPHTCQWTLYCTAPDGRVAPFGDVKIGARTRVNYIAAVAAAARDPYLQGFYLEHAQNSDDPRELLWFDGDLEPEPLEDRLPLGRAFAAHGACISSRSNWNSDAPGVVVYGKAGREENHEHNDVGQVCIDAEGRRLIVDLGSPSAYPEDFFGENRWRYYNASARGHNVLLFDDEEPPTDSEARGKIVHAEFDDHSGGGWRIDLTPAYRGVERVQRAVLHLFPGIVAVLDEAVLPEPRQISLRWHTADRCNPDDDGRFLVRNGSTALAARVVEMTGVEPAFRRGDHRYQPPFDRDRLGDPLEQRRESFVETCLVGDHCRLLSLFAVFMSGTEPQLWRKEGEEWCIDSAWGTVYVGMTGERLWARDQWAERKVEILL